MNKLFYLIIIVSLVAIYSLMSQNPAIIIDHNCTKLSEVPDSYILKAISTNRLAYGHTSHGSQIITGMDVLRNIEGSIYQFNNGSNSLYIKDGISGDLGNPDRTTWATETRELLASSTDINLIMWSWCGQVSSATETDINTYLSLMNQLELDYPNVRFIYMTGHLDGSGLDGKLHLRNEQIRNYCKENGKILFDFADIESYDPDGNNYIDKNPNDNCDYTGGNWAIEWCNNHPNDCKSCGCAHSQCINCQQKGKAFWWLLARINGWSGSPSIINDIDLINNNFISKARFNNNSNSINITYFSKLNGNININIYDLLGNYITSKQAIKNNYEDFISFDFSNYNSGVYLYNIELNGQIVSFGKIAFIY